MNAVWKRKNGRKEDSMLDEYTLSGQDMVTILQAIDTIKRQADSTLQAIDSFKTNFEAVSDYCSNLDNSIKNFMYQTEDEDRQD